MIDLAKRTVLQRLHKLGCGVLKKQKHERLHAAEAQAQLFGISHYSSPVVPASARITATAAADITVVRRMVAQFQFLPVARIFPDWDGVKARLGAAISAIQ